MRKLGPLRTVALVALLAAPLATPSMATNGGSADSTCLDQLQAAADWAGLPVEWVREVMRAESGGRRFAISNAGAMGCMQLMPGTWAELTARYGLGRDPMHPRANMFGGAAYLRNMVDRFGWPSALAAYHAGPHRMAQYLDRARPLPPETRAYVATIIARTDVAPTGAVVPVQEADWRHASLFAALSLGGLSEPSPATNSNPPPVEN